MKKAFISGVTGQDGSYLAEFLLKKIMKFMQSLEEVQFLHRTSRSYFRKS